MLKIFFHTGKAAVLLLLFAGLFGCSALGPPDAGSLPREEEENVTGFTTIEMDKSLIEFDDGDTIGYKGTVIRFMGVDTPEIVHEEHGIYRNQEMGPEASEFTKNQILDARRVEYVPYGRDTYGRLLAHILVDGELLAVRLIKAGLAYETISYYGDYGFKEYSGKIMQAWSESPKPKFQNPRLWRRIHQKKGD